MAGATSEDIVLVNGIPLPLRKTRKQIVIGTLLFCAAVIVGVVWKGEPTNTLHTSALAWAFSSSIAVIMGYVFGAVYDNYNLYKLQESLTKNAE